MLVKGIVPTGFMPHPLGAGAPYGLCHDDLHSAALLQVLAGQHQASKPHPGHSQDQGSHHAAHAMSHEPGQHDQHMPAPAELAPTAQTATTSHNYPDGNCNFANSFAKATVAFAVTIDLAVTPALPPRTDLPVVFPQAVYRHSLARAPPRTA